MSKRVVIGLGSVIRRDDGIGIVILESLLSLPAKKDTDYLNFGTASFGLIHRLGQYDKALLIDAIDAGLSAGELRIFKLEKIEYDFRNHPLSSHELNLKDLAALCKKISIKTKIYVAGIQIKDVSFGEGISKELKAKSREIIKKIRSFISKEFR